MRLQNDFYVFILLKRCNLFKKYSRTLQNLVFYSFLLVSRGGKSRKRKRGECVEIEKLLGYHRK